MYVRAQAQRQSYTSGIVRGRWRIDQLAILMIWEKFEFGKHYLEFEERIWILHVLLHDWVFKLVVVQIERLARVYRVKNSLSAQSVYHP